MSNIDVRGYLEQKGHTVKDAPAGNVHLPCFFCGEEEGKRGRLYVNIEDDSPPGLFKCFLCDESGAFNKIRKWHGDPALNEDGDEYSKGGTEDTRDSYKSYKILNAAASYYHELLLEDQNAYRYLTQSRGLTEETINKHQLG